MRILIIEDDQSLLMAVQYHLKKAGLDVAVCMDGLSGLETLRAESFDLVLLDRMLPGMDGVTLLAKIRAERNTTPVLMLTAMDGIQDRVAGLDAGADDYLVKPFAMDELLARVRALSRRKAPWTPQDTLESGDLVLHTQQMALNRGKHSVTLSKREGALMAFLMRNSGQVLPRSVILDRVWQDTIVEEGNLDIYIHFLRKHLSALDSTGIIRTVRGIGYQFVTTSGA